MVKNEYQRQQMLHEYDTLRAEILQLYEQQTSLVFGGTIIIAASLLATLVQSSSNLLVLPALLIVLIGICFKSIANYTRIFRNGSYLAIVHEQHGQPTKPFKLGPERAAWHSRWRELARSGILPWIGGEGPRAEAWFLSLLGMAGWFLVGGILREQLIANVSNIVILSASVILTVCLLCRCCKLANVVKDSKKYEQAFRRLIKRSKAAKSKL